MCVLAWKRGIDWRCPAHAVRLAPREHGRQVKSLMAAGRGPAKGWELVIPIRKLKLIDQVREVLRVKQYAIEHPTSSIQHPTTNLKAKAAFPAPCPSRRLSDSE